MVIPPATFAGPSALNYLDLAHPSLYRRLDDQALAGQPRFIRVVVAEVRNPSQTALVFDLSWLTAGAGPLRVGGFSLYPADHPGIFIVRMPTQLSASGSVLLTLRVLQKIDSAAPPIVGIGTVDMVRESELNTPRR